MDPRRHIGFALAVAILAAAGVSCEEKAEPEKAPVLTAVSTSLDASAGSIFLSVSAGGDWTISLDFGRETAWGSVSPSSGSGDRNSVIFSYDENGGKEDRSAAITLSSAGGESVLTIVQKGHSSPSVSGYDIAPVGWLELPRTNSGDGLVWFAHDMQGGDYFTQKGGRNWSFEYDPSSRLSRWVAYPLNKALIGSGSRTNAWGFDPLLPIEQQQSIVSGAYGTGHSRGHQIPSADRLTYAANVSTFFATNMTPQDYNFNGGIWADLETRVRGYATQSDTLYVVTGCVIDSASGTLTDRAGHPVRIPSAYFKALLRYMPGSTVGYGGYLACGFYLPHSASIANGKCTDYILSVEELERKTGFTFFVNLPAKVGAATADKIKSETPVSWWK